MPPPRPALAALPALPALLALALTLAACGKHDLQRAAPAPCARMGDNCEFSPGKLGTCVIKEGCEGPSCLVCQSQH